MLSKRYESTKVDRRIWLHVPSGTHLSNSSGTHQVVKIEKETSIKMYTQFSVIFKTYDIHICTYFDTCYCNRPLVYRVLMLKAI